MSLPRAPFHASYVLPIAAATPQLRALTGYLKRLGRVMEDVIVVDGSPGEVFDAHARAWSGAVRHIRPAYRTTNGKVGGVMTGVRAARHEHVIVADDDVRYRRAQLARMLALLHTHEVVRPQNIFRPLPWHARWDTARSLLNRLAGGDWPGTLGVRRSILLDAGGYSGDVLFENLEMVRTVRAAGGREAVPLDLFVERRPPPARHFLSQRVRQAYDEWARPARFAAQLALLPGGLLLSLVGGPFALGAAAAGSVAVAELGRRKAGGRTAFAPSSAFWAPVWLAERAVTSWMALGTGLFLGGVRYRTTRLRHAATPRARLEQKVQTALENQRLETSGTSAA
ncbi:glycosyltransferase family 2 protein [Novosphingobium sp. CCH12-A3]|uniref:glycosyltransferase n=1 Tax=Novosphingobium sp. CCH12-A3 TaxID=1768752 RepID=UPI0007801C3C|nr:glycosyltransferase family 2 protein [Novosphingobium sp. CCH12-A3]